MSKETEEIVIFGGVGLLVLLLLKGGLGNSSATLLKEQQLQSAQDIAYAGDATSVLSDIFD